MIVIMEDIYDQIMRQNVVRDSYFWKEWLKTTLKVFAFNYLDIDNKQYFLDNEHLNVLRELRNKFAILQPDKGRRIALINLDDLINSIRNIFDDSTKLKKLIKDHAITRLTAVQNILIPCSREMKLTNLTKNIVTQICKKSLN